MHNSVLMRIIYLPNPLEQNVSRDRKSRSKFYAHVTVHRNKFLYNKTNQMHQFPKFTPAWNSTCFGQFLCPSSGVYSLYIRDWCMSYRFEAFEQDQDRTGFILLYWFYSALLVLFCFTGFILLLVCIPTSNRIKPVPSWSFSKAVFKLVWHTQVPSVQWINSWWWVEEFSEICRVSCRSKFGKLVHLVGFVIKKVVHKFKICHVWNANCHCRVHNRRPATSLQSSS